MSFPSMLSRADFAMVRLSLELLDPCRLDPFVLLRLRRGLLRSGRELFGDRVSQWFDAPLSDDPQALRRFQKPAPAFVIRPQKLTHAEWHEGEALNLEILFLGSGIQLWPDFLALFCNLGRSGLLGGSGCFDVVATDSLDVTGAWRPMHPAGCADGAFPDVLSVGWWLDSLFPLPESLRLSFSTPTRLVVNGHSLRRPQFRQLFPFMLRRVTSMLYYHCGLEPVEDIEPLFSVARQIEAEWEMARWIDWHEHGDESERISLGGLTGRLCLAGKDRGEIDWIVAISTLLGVGRGATFGAGRLDMPYGQDQGALKM